MSTDFQPLLVAERRNVSRQTSRQALQMPDELMLQQEQSPAYKALNDAGLMVQTYRLQNASELDVVPGNSTLSDNFYRRGLAYTAGLGVGGIIYDALVNQFTVKDGHVRPASHSDGSFFFYGPGVHRISNLFITIQEDKSLQEKAIKNGNRAIVTVPQGFIGLAFDRGQPILLAPGLHQWKSDTLNMQELIDLSADVIRIGPFTLLTVDEGYAAITQDNGKQKVLPGGSTYMLNHRNWKFEKLISLKLHTDDLGPFRATSADNVVLETTATVNWSVKDPVLAARMAADTMDPGKAVDSNPKAPNMVAGQGNNSTLRRDVLKQAIGSLAAAIGSIRYADDVHIAASDKVTVDVDKTEASSPEAIQRARSIEFEQACGVSQIFSVQQMASAVKHSNEICTQYGVSIVSINVISAVPVDKRLEETLSAGAVAAAGAQQAEIASRGNAKARLIDAQSEAAAARIRAQAAASAEVAHAEGKKDAAALLETSAVAVDLARLEKTGQLLGSKTSFFFGASPTMLPNLLSNPNFMKSLNDGELPGDIV